MKILAVSILTLFFTMQSFAQSEAIVCSSGELGEDNFLQVTVLGSFVKVQQHEMTFSTTMSGSLVAAFLQTYQKDVTVYAEGEEFPIQLTSIVALSGADNSLLVYMDMGDAFGVIDTKLSCE